MGWIMAFVYWIIQFTAVACGSLLARVFFGPVGNLAATMPKPGQSWQADRKRRSTGTPERQANANVCQQGCAPPGRATTCPDARSVSVCSAPARPARPTPEDLILADERRQMIKRPDHRFP
jgi:hypothetical protein